VIARTNEDTSRGILEAQSSAARDLQEALKAESKTVALENGKADAVDIADYLAGQVGDIDEELGSKQLEWRQLTDKKNAAQERINAFNDSLASTLGKSKGARQKRNKLQDRIDAELGGVVAIDERMHDISVEGKALNADSKQLAKAEKEHRRAIEDIDDAQKNAFMQRLAAEVALDETREKRAAYSALAKPLPVSRPQTRSETRRKQETAALEKVLSGVTTRSRASARGSREASSRARSSSAAAEEEFKTPHTTGENIAILRDAATKLGIPIAKGEQRVVTYKNIFEKDPELARKLYRHVIA
jgi:chromosome segregation ATPase